MSNLFRRRVVALAAVVPILCLGGTIRALDSASTPARSSTMPADERQQLQLFGPTDRLDALVEQGLKDWQVPGLALAVVKDGKVVLARGYGVRSLKTREPVTPDTLFYIASATKSFTATLAAMMVEEGKAAWDRPLRADFPSFRMYDPVATERVTLRDMLSHRTGVPRQEFLKVHAPDRRTDLVDRIRHFEPAVEFRSGFRYSNEVVTVAGDLLAQRAGTTWEDMVRRRIFAPLGMSRSAVDVREMKAAGNYASPYIVRQKDPEEMAFYDVAELRGPAGAVISSVNDMSHWLLFNLNRGQWQGRTIVGAQELAPLYTPQMAATVRPPRCPELSYQSYGLGWFIDTYRGSLRISHPGNLYGFTSMVSFLPREKVGVVVLANLNGTPLPEIIERFVYDTLLGLDVVDWTTRTKDDYARARAALEQQAAEPDPGRRPEEKPSRPLDAYAGTYANPGYGTFVIRRDGGTLEISVHSGTFPLKPYAGDTFEFYHPVEDESWLLAFDKAGPVHPAAITIDIGAGLKPLVFTRARAAAAPQAPAIERKTCRAPDGVPMVYSAAGSGEPALIFIHGGLANRGFWDGELRRFAAGHRVIAPDLVGHGESGANRTKWGLPEFGADIRAIVEAEHLGKVVIFGNSLGGPVAIEAALLLGDKVLGVVGVDTFQNLDYVMPADQMQQRAEAFRSDYPGSLKQMMKLLFHPDADPALVADAERRMAGTSPEAAYGMFLGMRGYDQGAAARRLAVPLLAINGDLFPTDVAALRKVKADFEAVVMTHAGHYPMLERPEEFDRLVGECVRRFEGRSRTAKH